jgi:hypothetical protein
MNWGKGIAIALVLFMGFIVYLAVVLMTNKVDLESEDYYQQEMAYDTEMKAIKNANTLNEKIAIKTNEKHVLVSIPEGKFEEIRVDFKRPDDEKLDFFYDIKGTKMFTIERSSLKKGKYNIQISYKFDGEICLQKESIYIE